MLCRFSLPSPMKPLLVLTLPRLCFHGMIQSKEISILLDSRSSHTFISAHLSTQLAGITTHATPVKAQVANGCIIQCVSELLQVEWSINGFIFHFDLKVLPLQCYDMIVGMDWLEFVSPMRIDWHNKWVAIPYHASTILQGILPSLLECSVIQVYALEDVSEDTQPIFPDYIQAIMEEFATVFAEPSGIPPSQHCDHAIPLIPGARPVNVQPYRYPPALKDEIEKQVAAMLDQGVIQHSNSPFCSPVLLVKKKD